MIIHDNSTVKRCANWLTAASGWGNWSTPRFTLGHWVKKMCRNNVMASFEWSVLSCLVEKFFALKVKWHKDITYLADNRHLLNFPQQWSPARRLLFRSKTLWQAWEFGGGFTVGRLEAMPHVFQSDDLSSKYGFRVPQLLLRVCC